MVLIPFAPIPLVPKSLASSVPNGPKQHQTNECTVRLVLIDSKRNTSEGLNSQTHESSKPYHTIPYHTIPYRTMPYHTVPYPTLPCPTLPYPALPYPTSEGLDSQTSKLPSKVQGSRFGGPFLRIETFETDPANAYAHTCPCIGSAFIPVSVKTTLL